jgi:hypothetical protein
MCNSPPGAVEAVEAAEAVEVEAAVAEVAEAAEVAVRGIFAVAHARPGLTQSFWPGNLARFCGAGSLYG